MPEYNWRSPLCSTLSDFWLQSWLAVDNGPPDSQAPCEHDEIADGQSSRHLYSTAVRRRTRRSENDQLTINHVPKYACGTSCSCLSLKKRRTASNFGRTCRHARERRSWWSMPALLTTGSFSDGPFALPFLPWEEGTLWLPELRCRGHPTCFRTRLAWLECSLQVLYFLLPARAQGVPLRLELA